jgi:toxin FitB
MARGRSLKFLLDTNIISEIRKRDRAHPNVIRWVARTPVGEIWTSVLVLAEIRRGIELKRRSDREQAKSLDRWFVQMRARLGDRVLPVDEPVAEAWALLGIPNPLPLIDGLLAATAKVHGLMLVTRNVADLAAAGVSLLDPFSEV